MNADEIIKSMRGKLSINLSPSYGIVERVNEQSIVARGLKPSLGDVVEIRGKASNILGMVSSLERDSFVISPFSFSDGFNIDDRVFLHREGLKVPVGEELLGRVIDCFGKPLDEMGEISTKEEISIISEPLSAIKRGLIDEVFSVGVRGIDGLLTCGKGQKVGIFAGSGVGKSSLLGMIARGAAADIKVIALIGERGREVNEFIKKNLNNSLENTILVVATSDSSPLMRKYGAFSAISIAEYFKNKNKDVLFIMDSLTRFAMAQREIGLSLGEPPTSKGYPPSVLSLLPKLMERAGKEEGKGSISAFFTVLVEGDDLNDPISDQSRSILDGHIVLSRELTQMGIYPPLDILSSQSRVMNDVVNDVQKINARLFRKMYSLIKENEVLIRIGAYNKGVDKDLDLALSLKGSLDAFLAQDEGEISSFNDTVEALNAIFNF